MMTSISSGPASGGGGLDDAGGDVGLDARWSRRSSAGRARRTRATARRDRHRGWPGRRSATPRSSRSRSPSSGRSSQPSRSSAGPTRARTRACSAVRALALDAAGRSARAPASRRRHTDTSVSAENPSARARNSSARGGAGEHRRPGVVDQAVALDVGQHALGLRHERLAQAEPTCARGRSRGRRRWRRPTRTGSGQVELQRRRPRAARWCETTSPDSQARSGAAAGSPTGVSSASSCRYWNRSWLRRSSRAVRRAPRRSRSGGRPGRSRSP